jgi:hypothetical protein
VAKQEMSCLLRQSQPIRFLFVLLRAATSLHRLCKQQSKRGEESGSLADFYSRFTEGFDTYDLMNARGLIDEMQKDRNGNTNQSRH